MKEARKFESRQFEFEVVEWDKERLVLTLRHGGETYRWVCRDGKALCTRDLERLTAPQSRDMQKQAAAMLEHEFQRQHEPVPVAS